MATIIQSDHYLKQADSVVPVPLFWWKRLRRGYDQAALLSETVSKECCIPITNSIRRTKNTKTQTKLDERKRRENVMNAFTVRTDRIKDKSVLLIDDVLTTGATMNECARVLKEAGAKEVYSCVAAITPG